MTVGSAFNTVLAAELAALNERQLAAVLHDGDLVVRAGPGSGKTRTLVAKVGHLLDARIPPRQGLAAITFTRKAADEIVTRLDWLGICPGRRLAASTLHSWCLSAIVRPYAPLVGEPVPGDGEVIDDDGSDWLELLQESFDEVRLPLDPRHERATIRKLRREIAAGITLPGEGAMVRAAVVFDEIMRVSGYWDFDAMVAQALDLVRQHPKIAHLVAVRYPWLVVDEYQDLGPVLHALVQHLREACGVRVAAFGDPDQTVLGFTGANPRYLNELALRPGVRDLSLNLNYRSGRAIVAASQAVLQESRAYHADPEREDPGTIEPVPVHGGLDQHAAAMIGKLDELVGAGMTRHRIAVLYPSKGPVLDEILKALGRSSHGYVHERDQRLPDGDLADFVRDCAGRAMAGPQPGGLGNDGAGLSVPTLGQLTKIYKDMRRLSGLPEFRGRIAERGLASLVSGVEPTLPLGDWIDMLAGQLELDAVARHSTSKRDQRALDGFRAAGVRHSLTVKDIAAGVLRVDKITVTTYHSAKGREWDAVVLPGLVEPIMPRLRRARWGGGYQEPHPDQLAEYRRTFYVAVTRARRAVVLLYGDSGAYSTSRFVRDILTQLGSVP